MKPNGTSEKRPRAWDISVRPAQKKKRPAQKKKRAAFSAKQLVFDGSPHFPFSQFPNFSLPPGATKKSLTRVSHAREGERFATALPGYASVSLVDQC